MCPFSPPPGKQPFEQIVFGCRKGGKKLQPLPEENKLIISVPSAIHSHKPPLKGKFTQKCVFGDLVIHI